MLLHTFTYIVFATCVNCFIMFDTTVVVVVVVVVFFFTTVSCGKSENIFIAIFFSCSAERILADI